MAIATGTAIALGLMAAAAAANTYNTKQTLKKQDNAAAAGIRQQGANRREAQGKVDEVVDAIGKGKGKNGQSALTNDYLQRVQSSMAQANAGLGQKVFNADFAERAGGAAAANADYGDTTARLLSTIDGAADQRRAEGNMMGDVGMDISRIGGNAAGDAHLTDLTVRGIRRNPYIDLASSLMQGAATGMAGAGGAGNTATATMPSGMTYTAPATRAGNSWLNAYGAGGF